MLSLGTLALQGREHVSDAEIRYSLVALRDAAERLVAQIGDDEGTAAHSLDREDVALALCGIGDTLADALAALSDGTST